MTEPTHTPAPWRKQDGWPRGYGFIVAGDLSDPIAYCSQLASTNHANGDLIAAAPDLLAACEMALDCQANCSGVCLSCAAVLRTAIAKAKGDPCPTE